ncbi:3-hydroxyacyl-CoA dehydrogenase NAD-binding domain-containing protein [Bythopirellula polymerisocia]|uniref:enoyl-CoA hydratase n=1 Tax=Bythopirellula polymerisocia TaxID=2528003 RepID=A0A5C6D2G5_9BACT|nr:3-hydroxyacyl-CoA dehydrogenase NAD-binding domain-containing protein [Bythopirellula polymerisocia]TWU30044.1 Fatty acid oxidation complex subunit alpha [Bythopirellula polymerisocia]
MSEQSILSLDFPADDVAVITINDPTKKVNILAQGVLANFSLLLDELEARGGLAGLVIQSTKPGNFIAGANLHEFVANIDEPDENTVKLSREGHTLFGRLTRCPFVTVAAINGLCLGGGSELAVWCDRRVMARDPKASFGFPEVKLGLFPGWGGTARTPRIVGLSNAVELVTSGENVNTAAAEAMGLAISAPADRLLESAIALVRSEQESKEYLRDRELWSAPISISDTELAFLGATASAYIQGKTKGHYPAPMAALEVMLGGAGVDLETACQMEAQGFAELFGSPENRALLNVFFLQDHNKKVSGPPGSEPREIQSAAVVGAGVMGQGIAAANIKRRIPVALGDTSTEAVTRGVQGVITEVSYNKETRESDAKRAIEFLPLLNGTESDAEIATADIVIEAIYENAEAKRKLYFKLEPQLGPEAILCSNTSTIPITELAHGLEHPERFCGLHFFNPVRQMPLVEVISGKQTSGDTIATAVAYAKVIGKSPIVVQDGPGFLVNRVLLPYMNEALLLLESGASIKAVDRAAKSFGMPMGPIELYDTVGLDIALHAGKVMQQAFPDRVVPSKILPAMVEAGRIGKKAGKGFFDYTTDGKGRTKPQPSAEAEEIIGKFSSGKCEDDLTDCLFLPMLLEATRVVEDDIVADVRDVDLGLIYGIGFPPFKGGLFFWADTLGAVAIVEKLAAFQHLGARFEPTALLLEHAERGDPFYSAVKNHV